MASPASKKRNTAPMDGNAAYDLHSTAAEEYRYSAPVEMPHAPRTTEAVVPESVPTPKQAIAPMAVLGFAIAAVLIVVSLVACSSRRRRRRSRRWRIRIPSCRSSKRACALITRARSTSRRSRITPSTSSACRSRAAISSIISAATPRTRRWSLTRTRPNR